VEAPTPLRETRSQACAHGLGGNASTLAFAPAEAPRVAVAIVAGNAGFGEQEAAPIARRVLAAASAHSTTL